ASSADGELRKAASTPSRASAIVSGTARSARTDSAPGTVYSGFRDRARTRAPDRSSSGTRAEPAVPDAPAARMVGAFMSMTSFDRVGQGVGRESRRAVNTPGMEKASARLVRAAAPRNAAV